MWIFEKQLLNHRARNPITDEFFTDESIRSDIEALIRESIQNSLDAGNGGRVRVVFKLGGINQESTEKWFSTLKPHVGAALGDEVAATIDLPCRYLAIEDFNTSGLRGDPQMPIDFASKSLVNPKDLAYYYFVHAEGESGKSDSRGTWGVGKIVFPKLSQVKSFLFLSDREADQVPTTVALGQSILKLHSIDGNSYIPDGWLSNQNNLMLHTPVDDSIAEELRHDFELCRTRGVPGLSVVIPFVSPGITSNALISAIVSQYYVPLLMGDLECEIQDGSNSEVVNDDNLTEILEGLLEHPDSKERAEKVKPNLALLEAHVSGEAKGFAANYPAKASAPEHLIVEDDALVEIAEALSGGGVVSVNVSVTVPLPNKEGTKDDHFNVLLRKGGDRNRVAFSREGVLVPQQRAINLTQHSALTLVNRGALGSLLSSAEGPAHNDWSDGARKFRENFANAAQPSNVIKLVRQTAKQIERLLQGLDGAMELDIFANFFNVENDQAGGGNPNPSGKPGGKGGTGENPTPPPPKLEKYSVSARPGGFRLSLNRGEGNYSVGSKLRVGVAYKVAKGDSFSKWSANDFELKHLAIDSESCETLAMEDNFALVKPKKNDFFFEVLGIDTTLRDLEITVQEVSDLEENGQ